MGLPGSKSQSFSIDGHLPIMQAIEIVFATYNTTTYLSLYLVNSNMHMSSSSRHFIFYVFFVNGTLQSIFCGEAIIKKAKYI